jgi:hypothetical protein
MAKSWEHLARFDEYQKEGIARSTPQITSLSTVAGQRGAIGFSEDFRSCICKNADATSDNDTAGYSCDKRSLKYSILLELQFNNLTTQK